MAKRTRTIGAFRKGSGAKRPVVTTGVSAPAVLARGDSVVDDLMRRLDLDVSAALQLIDERYQQIAPRDTGNLADSLEVAATRSAPTEDNVDSPGVQGFRLAASNAASFATQLGDRVASISDVYLLAVGVNDARAAYGATLDNPRAGIVYADSPDAIAATRNRALGRKAVFKFKGADVYRPYFTQTRKYEGWWSVGFAADINQIIELLGD